MLGTHNLLVTASTIIVCPVSVHKHDFCKKASSDFSVSVSWYYGLVNDGKKERINNQDSAENACPKH